jgi:hypothetical protein
MPGWCEQFHVGEFLVNLALIHSIVCFIMGLALIGEGNDALIGGSVYFGIMYIVSMVVAALIPAREYVANTKFDSGLLEHVEVVKAAQPTISMHGEAYHYETRTEHYTNSDGSSGTRTRQEKVTTHTACELLRFDYCED